MKFLGIIPARYASTRFPGKPLADLGGKPMIRWVYEGAAKGLSHIVVATDHPEIEQAVKEFGGRVMMTNPDHQSGTDRCAEVIQRLRNEGEYYDVALNIQGDEPFLTLEHIDLLKEAFSDPGVQIATLATRLDDVAELQNPNVVKLVHGLDERAIYFSRHPIPFLRSGSGENPLIDFPYMKHLGVYAYLAGTLLEITKSQPTPLEKAESLEQLRWLENGYHIKVRVTTKTSMGIDTPEDLTAARNALGL